MHVLVPHSLLATSNPWVTVLGLVSIQDVASMIAQSHWMNPWQSNLADHCQIPFASLHTQHYSQPRAAWQTMEFADATLRDILMTMSKSLSLVSDLRLSWKSSSIASPNKTTDGFTAFHPQTFLAIIYHFWALKIQFPPPSSEGSSVFMSNRLGFSLLINLSQLSSTSAS